MDLFTVVMIIGIFSLGRMAIRNPKPSRMIARGIFGAIFRK